MRNTMPVGHSKFLNWVMNIRKNKSIDVKLFCYFVLPSFYPYKSWIRIQNANFAICMQHFDKLTL